MRAMVPMIYLKKIVKLTFTNQNFELFSSDLITFF